MTVVKLILGKEETREKQYIIDRVAFYNDFELEIVDSDKFCILNISSERKCFRTIIKDIVYSVICLFYKCDALCKELLDEDTEITPKQCAIVGAMLSFDGGEEYKKVVNCIDCGNTICIKSLYQFRLQKLTESWQGLVALVSRLLSQCETKEDYFDLIFFLLAVEKDLAPKVNLVIERNNFSIYTDGILLPLPHLLVNDQLNALIVVVRERPKTITIKGVELLSSEIYDVLKELGNG